MTIKELIEKLQKFPSESHVYMEITDGLCTGQAQIENIELVENGTIWLSGEDAG